MCYAVIINKIEHLECFSILDNSSIFEMILKELIKFNQEIFIVINKSFESKIFNYLNKNNDLINSNVNLISLNSKLDNYYITFLISNLTNEIINLIPLDDFSFNNEIFNYEKKDVIIKKKIAWRHPIYSINPSNFKSKFIINKNYKECPIEYFIKHKRNVFELFFNKYYKWNDVNEISNAIINNIKKSNYYKLFIYKFE